MKSQPRVCCYVRVSTEEQNADSQEIQLREYCQRRGWSEKVGFFIDHASGTERTRGALGVMMDEVREGTVDVVLTWKIDRLARSLNHLAQLLAEFQTHNVALVCPSQGIDTTASNPCAEFQINILAAVAQFERELIVERVKVGIAAAKQRGVKLGRPSKAQQRWNEIERQLEMGVPPPEISRKLGIPYSTVTELVRKNVKTASAT
jgi:DNA invertase Pin-like site-specific DNA recombinase